MNLFRFKHVVQCHVCFLHINNLLDKYILHRHAEKTIGSRTGSGYVTPCYQTQDSDPFQMFRIWNNSVRLAEDA